MNKKIWILILMVAGYAGVALLGYISKPEQNIVLPPEAIKPVIVCPNDTESFSSINKKVLLISNKNSNGLNGDLRGYKITLSRTGLTSDIACGYLNYEISFNNKPVEQKYMALSMRPTDSQLGGHIWPDESKGAIVTQLNDRTRILLPLDRITYDGTNKNPIKEANWVSLLNVADEIEFQIALSAAVESGKINLAEIAFKCINKDTGKETDTCDLKVSKTEPFGF